MQLENVDQETLAEIYKMSSVGLCPNVVGQVVVTRFFNLRFPTLLRQI